MRAGRQQASGFPTLQQLLFIAIGITLLVFLVLVGATLFFPTPPRGFLLVLDTLLFCIALVLLFTLYRLVIVPMHALVKYVQTLESRQPAAFDTPAVREMTLLADAIQRTYQRMADHLHEVEAYQDMIWNMPLGVLRLDTEGRILSANAATATIAGVSSAIALVGRSIHEFWRDDDAAEQWRTSIANATHPITLTPIAWRRADGTPRWARLDISPVFDAEGTLVELLCALTDITEPIEAREHLRIAEQRYRFLVESASEGICTIDQEGRIRYANAAFAALVGMPREQLEGLSWKQLCFEEDIPHAYQLWQYQSSTAEFRIRRADGTERWAYISVGELPAPQSHAERWIVLATDIQAQKEARDALAQSEAYFRALVQHSRDSILVLDEHLRVRFMSDAGFRFSGYTPDEVLGQPLEYLLVPEDRPYARERLQEALQNPDRAVSAIARYRRKNGTVRTLACIATNLLHNPIVRGIVINAHDIHDYVLLQQELERALQNASSDQWFETHLLAMASEFTKPLHRIANNLNQVLADSELGTLHTQAIEDALKTTRTLHTLVDEMVRSAIIVAQETAFTEVDLNELVQTVLKTLAPLIQTYQTTVILDELPRVQGHPAQLSLLFQALLEYSIQHTNTSTPLLRLSAERDDEMWKIAIYSSGTSIAPENMARLFTLLLTQETDLTPGTRLRFVSCRHIVERHAGRIWAHTEPDRGTTFYFTLPTASPSNTNDA